MFIRTISLLLFGFLILISGSGADDFAYSVDHDIWQEPNAWEIHSPSKTCSVCETTVDNGLVTTYYKRIVAELFNRSTLKLNAETGNFEKSMFFSFTNGQLKILENSSNVRELNDVLMTIFALAKELEPPKQTERNSTWTNIYEILEFAFLTLLKSLKYIWKFVCQVSESFSSIYSYSSEVRFGMFVCTMLLSIWFIYKRYNMNLLLVLVGSFIVFGYFCTYIECNRKLSAEQFIEFVQETEPEENNFYFVKIIKDFLKLSNKDEKIMKIKKEAKLKLPFCRPDHVAVMYFNDIFFGQLEVIIEKLSESTRVLYDKLPFPFNCIGIIALPFLFMSLIPFLFQYVLNPTIWIKVFGTLNHKHHHNYKKNDNVPHEDRLSGDNLKILFEVLKTKAEEIPKSPGVEEVKSLPEPTSKPSAIEYVKELSQEIPKPSRVEDVNDLPEKISTSSAMEGDKDLPKDIEQSEYKSVEKETSDDIMSFENNNYLKTEKSKKES